MLLLYHAVAYGLVIPSSRSATPLAQQLPYVQPISRRLSLMKVDEGHRLKNHRCTLLSSLKRLKADNRLLLSGTPIQSKHSFFLHFYRRC